MRNIKSEIKDGVLYLEIDLNAERHIVKKNGQPTGTEIVASTFGYKPIAGIEDMSMNLIVLTRKREAIGEEHV